MKLCVLYTARLISILDAYLESRKVSNITTKRTDLLICDQIKATLPENCLRHILAIESTEDEGWLPSHELAEAMDLYFANRWPNDKPRVGVLGVPPSNKMVEQIIPHRHLTTRILEGQMLTGKTPTVNQPVSLLGAVMNVGQRNI